MKKIVLSLHTTVDGFLAGPNGEMNWIRLDEELFDIVGSFTREADTAFYGRVTYEMMESYWPTAADKPNATKHDREHSAWYKKVNKVVLSKTIKAGEIGNTTVIGDNIAAEVARMKEGEGGNILMFGSATAAHSLMQHNLIDEYWLFINPILLGKGIPVFSDIKERVDLELIETVSLKCGVTALHYRLADRYYSSPAKRP